MKILKTIFCSIIGILAAYQASEFVMSDDFNNKMTASAATTMNFNNIKFKPVVPIIPNTDNDVSTTDKTVNRDTVVVTKWRRSPAPDPIVIKTPPDTVRVYYLATQSSDTCATIFEVHKVDEICNTKLIDASLSVEPSKNGSH